MRTRRRFLAAAAGVGLAGCLITRREQGDHTDTQYPHTTGGHGSGTDTRTSDSVAEPPTIDAVGGSWTHPRADPAGTRFDPGGAVPGTMPLEAWAAEAGGEWAQVAVADGRIVVATRGEVAALDARTGDVLWRHSLDPDADVSGPVLADDSYVGVDSELRALAPGNGSERWTVTMEGPVRRIAVSAGTVYVTTRRSGEVPGAVQAVADGDVLWTFRTDEVSVTQFGSIAVADGSVYAVGENSGSVTWHHALDAATGEQRWLADGLNHSIALTVADGAVLAGGFYGTVVAHDLGDGSERWKRERQPAVRQICTGPDQAYAASSPDEPDSLAALSLTSGEAAWANRGHGIVGAGDGLVAVDDGTLRGLDSATGAVRWERKGGPDVSGLAIADGVLFVATEDGMVRALTTAD